MGASRSRSSGPSPPAVRGHRHSTPPGTRARLHGVSDDPSDWDLVSAIRAGEDRAFDALLTRHRAPVMRFLYRMLRDASEAEDLAQDVFVNAHRAIITGTVTDRGQPFAAWLLQVARRAALDRLRWRRRHPAEALPEAGTADDAFLATRRTASDAAQSRETGDAIANAVSDLPEPQRTILILAEYEGQSMAAIGVVLGCSVKSVETRLYRARRFLRHRLAHLLA